jgi:predicted transcriptional regulator
MDALYRLGSASAAQLREEIPSPPSLTAVRTLLTILQGKGHVQTRAEGNKYIYVPTVSREVVAKAAISGVVRNFFEGSVERVVATLIDPAESNFSDEELDRLQSMIDEARRRGR